VKLEETSVIMRFSIRYRLLRIASLHMLLALSY
jgi:hypothetical protein